MGAVSMFIQSIFMSTFKLSSHPRQTSLDPKGTIAVSVCKEKENEGETVFDNEKLKGRIVFTTLLRHRQLLCGYMKL